MKKTCLNCGKEFEGRINSLYCPTICRMQAYRKRKNTAKTSVELYADTAKTTMSLTRMDGFKLIATVHIAPENVHAVSLFLPDETFPYDPQNVTTLLSLT